MGNGKLNDKNIKIGVREVECKDQWELGCKWAKKSTVDILLSITNSSKYPSCLVTLYSNVKLDYAQKKKSLFEVDKFVFR